MAITKVGTPGPVSIEYRVVHELSHDSSSSSEAWLPYTLGSEIVISETMPLGDNNYVQFRNTANTLSTDGSNRYTFVVGNSGYVSAVGDVSSMINYAPLTSGCFAGLFEGCAIGEAKYLSLPAMTLEPYCYIRMFRRSGIRTAPDLPATELASDCYKFMFEDCVYLTDMPELPATEMKSFCYTEMFSGCTSLVNTTPLRATVPGTQCYSQMFAGCTALKKAPVLYMRPSKGCYVQMFYGCSSLEYIEVMFQSWGDSPAFMDTADWVSGVPVMTEGSSTSGFIGVFRAPCMLPDIRGINNIPVGWLFDCWCVGGPEPCIDDPDSTKMLSNWNIPIANINTPLFYVRITSKYDLKVTVSKVGNDPWPLLSCAPLVLSGRTRPDDSSGGDSSSSDPWDVYDEWDIQRVPLIPDGQNSVTFYTNADKRFIEITGILDYTSIMSVGAIGSDPTRGSRKFAQRFVDEFGDLWDFKKGPNGEYYEDHSVSDPPSFWSRWGENKHYNISIEYVNTPPTFDPTKPDVVIEGGSVGVVPVMPALLADMESGTTADLRCRSFVGPHGLFANCTALCSADVSIDTDYKFPCFYGGSLLFAPAEGSPVNMEPYAFSKLFYGCTNLAEFVRSVPGTNGISARDQDDLENLKNDKLTVSGVYQSMFYGCTKLDTLTVGFTSWGDFSGSSDSGDPATAGWLCGTACLGRLSVQDGKNF